MKTRKQLICTVSVIIAIGIILMGFASQKLPAVASAQLPPIPTSPQQNQNVTVNSMITALSNVQGVDISGLNIASENKLKVDLKFRGNGSSPTVKIDATAMKFDFNALQELGKLKGMMQRNNQSGVANSSNTNMTELLNNSKFMSQLQSFLAISNGTEILESDWTSPKETTVNLNGNTSLNDANFITVMIDKQGESSPK
ncbi:MAG TPA: hypothetical protein VF884_11935 [Nitrososphaeraceae archaeon]